MATPFNPFGGRGQRGGTTISAPTSSRGRGVPSGRGAPARRGTQFQPRGSLSSIPRGISNTTRGRGIPQPRGRGRGRARGSVAPPNAGTSHSGTTENHAQPQAAASPFNQVNEKGSSPNPFGGLNSEIKPSLSGFSKAPASQTSLFNPQTASFNPQAAKKQNGTTDFDTDMGQSYSESDAQNKLTVRYEQLKLDRAKQRLLAIRDGQMADPQKPTSLNNAITPVGTCDRMCPEYESVERIVQKMVDKCEKSLDPTTGTLEIVELKFLKRFRRSAAGYDEQLPSDIRTPSALLQSTNYLIRHILGGNEPLGIIHKFVWDRTRSIRNDFSVQQLTQESDVKIAVSCLERIARFHIISHHILSSPENEEPFEHHQEREQLNNTMLSLMYYYDDNRGRIDFPNEDEFRAYHIILSIHDQRPDLEARVSRWPTSLLTSPRVKVALDLYAAACNTWEPQATLDVRRTNAIAQGFYARFFNIINSPSVSYLMACVAEIYFIDVRKTALRSIWNGYWRPPSKSNPDQMQSTRKEEWMISDLTTVLHFDNDEQTVEFCKQQNLPVGDSIYGPYLNWNFKNPQNIFPVSAGREHTYSDTCVEFKRAGRSIIAVILGMSVQEAARTSMIDKFELHARQDPSSRAATGVMDNMDMEDISSMEPENHISISDQFVDSSASSTPNPFQNAFSTGNNSPLGAAQISNAPPTMPTSQPSNLFQPSQSPNLFASMFPASTENNKPAATPTPPPSSSVMQQTPFPAPTPSQSPFSFPKQAEPSVEIKETSTPATFTPQPAPLFQTTKPMFPSADTKDTGISPAPLDASTDASVFKSASPFNFSVAKTETSTPTNMSTTTPSSGLFPAQNTSAQSSSSFFQPSPAPQAPASLFQPVQPKEQPVTTSSLFPSASTTTSIFSASTSGAPAATPSVFTPPPAAMPPPVQPPTSMFQTPALPVPAKEQAKESNIFSQSASKPAFAFSQPMFAKPPVETSVQSQSHVSVGTAIETSQHGISSPTPSLSSFSSSLPPAEPSKSSRKQPWKDGSLVEETEEERQLAWRRLLTRVAKKHEDQKRQSLIQERENETTRQQPEQESLQQSVQGSPRKRAWNESIGSAGRETKQLKVSDLVPISSTTGSASTIDEATKAPTKAPAKEPTEAPEKTLDDFLNEGILSRGMKLDDALDELVKKGVVRGAPTMEELDAIIDQHTDANGVFRIGNFNSAEAPWNDPVEKETFFERQRRMRAEIKERERKEFEDYMQMAHEARQRWESGSVLDEDFSTLPIYLRDPAHFLNKDHPDIRYVRPWNATWEDFRTENWVADDEEYDYTTSLGRALAYTDKTVRSTRAYMDERYPGWDAEWNPNRRPNLQFNVSRLRHNASIREPLFSQSLRPSTSQSPFSLSGIRQPSTGQDPLSDQKGEDHSA